MAQTMSHVSENVSPHLPCTALDWKDLEWTLWLSPSSCRHSHSLADRLLWTIQRTVEENHWNPSFNKTIWLSLYKVSVVSLCGTGVAAASLSTVKSRGCTVGESAAYRFIGRVPGSFPLLSCFVLFSGDALTIHCSPVSHFIYLLFRLFVCFSVGGVTWVNPCNVLWCEPVGSRIWKIWSKQMV